MAKKKVTIGEVRAAEGSLLRARRDFLTSNGWEENDMGRWHKDFPWGTGSTRRVEGDLKDAVNYQAMYDLKGRSK